MNIRLKEVTCKVCGWQGPIQDLVPVAVPLLDGDICYDAACPNCKSKRWEIDEL